MKTSERVAAAALVAMTAPAFLAFPALGLWYVTKVWPAMSGLDRGLFCASLATLLVGVPLLFRDGMARISRGEPEGLTPSAIVVLGAPMIVGCYALTHNWTAVLGMAGWMVLDCYLARKRQRSLAAGQAVSQTHP